MKAIVIFVLILCVYVLPSIKGQGCDGKSIGLPDGKSITSSITAGSSPTYLWFNVSSSSIVVSISLSVGYSNVANATNFYLATPGSCPSQSSYRYRGNSFNNKDFGLYFVPDTWGLWYIAIYSSVDTSYTILAQTAPNGEGAFLLGTTALSGYSSSLGMTYFALNTTSIGVGFVIESNGNSLSTYVSGTEPPLTYSYDGKSLASGFATNLTMCDAYTGIWYIGLISTTEQAFTIKAYVNMGPSTADQLSSGQLEDRILPALQTALFALDSRQYQLISILVQDLTTLGTPNLVIHAGQDSQDQCRPSIPSQYQAGYVKNGGYRLIYQSLAQEPQIIAVRSTWNDTTEFTVQAATINNGQLAMDPTSVPTMFGYVNTAIVLNIDVSLPTTFTVSGNVTMILSQDPNPTPDSYRVVQNGQLSLDPCASPVENGKWYIGIWNDVEISPEEKYFQVSVAYTSSVQSCDTPGPTSPIWPIVLGVVGGFAAFVIAVGIFWCIKRRRANKVTSYTSLQLDIEDLDEEPFINQ